MANDNFNFTPEDISAISGTFRESARIDRKRREREQGRDRGFWGELGMTLATGIAQQAVVAPVVESVASYVRKPYEDRDNVFLANFKNEENMQKSTARRAEVFRNAHDNLRDTGMSPEEIAASYQYDSIRKEIDRQQIAGELVDDVTDKPIGLEFINNPGKGDKTFKDILVRQLAMKKVMANDGEIFNSYMDAYKEAGDVSLGPDASKDFKESILRFNNTASSWVDSVKRMATGTSKQEVMDASVQNARDSVPEIEEVEQSNDAFKIYDQYKTPDAARAVFDAVEMYRIVRTVPQSQRETVSVLPYNRPSVDDNGFEVVQPGVNITTVNNQFPDKSTVVWQPTGEIRSMTTNADRARGMETIASLYDGATKNFSDDRKRFYQEKINNMHRNADDIPYNQASNTPYMNDSKYQASYTAVALMLQEAKTDPSNYRDSMTESLKQMNIAIAVELVKTEPAFQKHLVDNSLTKTRRDGTVNPEYVAAVDARETRIAELHKMKFGLDAEVAIWDEKNKKMIPTYHKLNEQGNAEPDPRYTDKTVADFKVAAEKFTFWKKGMPFTRKNEDELRKSLVSGDKPLFMLEDGKTLVLDTSTGDYVAIPTVVDTPEVTPDTETETKVTAVPTLTDTQKDELMAKAFPEENNVDIDEVFPSVVKQFSAAIQKDKDTIRKEMWVKAPEAESRAGQVAGQTVRSITYPVKEIYYNFLKPFGALGEAVVGEIVQEVGGLWEASTEALNNKDVDFMHRTNQIHTVLELKAERPNFKKEISEAAEKLFLMNPKIETGRLKQGIANLVFDSKDINKTVSDAEVDNEKTSATSSLLSQPVVK